MKKLLILVVVVLLAGGGYWYYTNSNKEAPVVAQPAAKPPLRAVGEPAPQPPEPLATSTPEAISLESYIKKHLGEFKAVQSKLGSGITITKVEVRGGKGTVYFESGTKTAIADFSYSVSEMGVVSIMDVQTRK